MKINLQNSCVLVTGASSGIGKELTKILVSKYNCLVIGVSRHEEGLIILKNEIEKEYKKGNNFLYLTLDVGKSESWKRIYDFCKNKKVKIIFNNAGIMPPFLKLTNILEEDLEKIFKTNFYSIFYCFKYFNKYFESLKEDCGIVNITSSSSEFLIPGQSVYSASKSAATKLSLITASEVKNKYFVGTYLPGFTNTNIFYSKNFSMPIFDNKIQNVITKLGATANKVANKIVKLTINKKRYKLMGKDSKVLKLLQAFCKNKSSDFILKIFKKSKYESFKNLI